MATTLELKISSARASEKIYELRSDGLIQNKDFDFYSKSYPFSVLFMFYNDKVFTKYALKWSSDHPTLHTNPMI